ncbi:TonB-dependent receptor [Alteromonas sp. M12]|uniref:TonB-dependent receptor n=1 Tax=Alteromonas sp. M12 TaxID=3135644 RepID=UPI00319E346B
MTHKNFRLTVVATAVSMVVCSAFAQDIPAEKTEVNSSLEVIEVTAQRKTENLQEVPIAITAVTSVRLEKSGIKGTDDLSLVTPGLQSGRQIGSSTPFLRGVGTSASAAGDESSIATYVDGIYSPNMVSNTYSFNNIERIEVLKGPQGTLFGRNATGGMIHIITKDPIDTFEGNFEASYGSYETTEFKGYLTGALSENVSANIAVLYNDQGEGWGTNLTTGKDVNYSNTEAVRAKVLFEPSTNTSIKLAAHYSETESDLGISRQLAPGALGIEGALVYGGCIASGASDAECVPLAIASASTYTGDWYNVDSNLTSIAKNRDWGTSLFIDHSFSTVDFKSISAYQESASPQIMDVDASRMSVQDAVLDIEMETFTQEIQLLSKNTNGYDWIIGFFYMDSTARYAPFGLDGAALGLLAPGLTSLRSSPEQLSESYAAFAQGSYDITESTKITLGGRITRDERELTSSQLFQFGEGTDYIVGIPEGTISDSWTEPTWRISIDHNLDSSALVYASYSRGFKSGVYNLAAAVTSGPNPDSAVNPEILDSVEVGYKADLLDDSIRINASMFYYDYADMQLQTVQSGAAVLLNAAEAEIKGAEVSLTWLASDNLTINSGLSLIDSEFSEFLNAPTQTPTGIGGNVTGVMDATGNKLIRTPDYTINIGADYTVFTDTGEVSANLTYYYNDGFYWEAENRLKQESYQIINALVSWTSKDEVWGVKVYGKNLLDEEYSYYSNSAQVGDAISAAPPRTFGIALLYNFY